MRLLIVAALFGIMAPESTAITGYISDTKCAMSGSKAKTAAEWIKPAAFEECVKTCVKDGSGVLGSGSSGANFVVIGLSRFVGMMLPGNGVRPTPLAFPVDGS